MQMSHNTKQSSNLHNNRGAAAEKTAPTNRYNNREIPVQPPNVIARLMGIDADYIPPLKPAAAAIVQAHPTTRSLLLKAPPPATTTAVAETKAISPRSAPFRQAKCSLLSYRARNNGRGDSSSSSSSQRHYCLKKMRVPGRSSRSHHHPQEDLLQKIKQDFQAWQASSSATQPPLLDGSRCIQMIAQEDLRRQKMARYGFSVADDTKAAVLLEKKKVVVPEEESDSETAAADGKVAFRGDEPQETVITVLRPSPCAAAASEKFRDFEAGKDEHESSSSSASDEQIMLRSTAPIVLLKPSSFDILRHVADGQKPLFGLPKLQRDGNMSRLLQDVKEMLQKELQQVNATSTSSNDKVTWATEPKQQIACRGVAQQARKETAAKQDRLSKRSESFRGFRSDRKRNDEASTKQASPEHVVRITRNNILARRPLKSVTSSRAQTVSSSPRNKDDEESMSSCSITSTSGRVVRSLADVSPPSGVALFGEQSFRSEECLTMRHRDDSSTVSPARALFRSFSAPESGFFSLGRLFQFGDATVRSTTTHEASEDAAALMTSKRRTSFSFIRGTVSGLRRHLLRRRKTHWSKKTSLGVGEIHPQMAIGMTPPSPPETFNLFRVAQANLTGLPPSPVSPLEVVGHSCRHLFSDFNCTFPELSPKCLSEFEAPASELSYRTDITVQTACSHDKAYIREVLVAAGLYDDDDDDGSLDNNKAANGRVDSMARPICDDIFEEVEDMYYYRGNYCDDAIGTGSAADHRMLFDLANEALQSLVMQGAKPGCSLRQWVIDSIGVSRGRRLVDDVWQQVQTLRNPEMQEMQTIDSMVAYEIRKSVWAEVLYQDVYDVGRKIERAIFDQLIEDLLVEVFI